MKRLLGFAVLLSVLLTQVAFARDAQMLQKLEEAIEANKGRIALISSMPTSSEGRIKVLPLSQQENNLEKPQCAETELGILVCTMDILGSCKNTEGVISMTLSYPDAEDLISPRGKNSFPSLVAKYERVDVPAIGCLGTFGQSSKKKSAN